MITKEINWDGYNLAHLKTIQADGSVLCDLEARQGDDILKTDTNISFPSTNLPFELTQEEIEELSNGNN